MKKKIRNWRKQTKNKTIKKSGNKRWVDETKKWEWKPAIGIYWCQYCKAPGVPKVEMAQTVWLFEEKGIEDRRIAEKWTRREFQGNEKFERRKMLSRETSV